MIGCKDGELATKVFGSGPVHKVWVCFNVSAGPEHSSIPERAMANRRPAVDWPCECQSHGLPPRKCEARWKHGDGSERGKDRPSLARCRAGRCLNRPETRGASLP